MRCRGFDDAILFHFAAYARPTKYASQYLIRTRCRRRFRISQFHIRSLSLRILPPISGCRFLWRRLIIRFYFHIFSTLPPIVDDSRHYLPIYLLMRLLPCRASAPLPHFRKMLLISSMAGAAAWWLISRFTISPCSPSPFHWFTLPLLIQFVHITPSRYAAVLSFRLLWQTRFTRLAALFCF